MKKTIFSKAIAILGSIAMLVGVAACGQSNDSTKTAADGNGLTKVTFMLSWAPDTNHIGVYVAKNKGYFKQAGLDVDIVAVAQAGAEQAVNNGMADFALSNLTNVGIYTLKGAKIKQVMQVQQKPSAIWCSLASNKDIKSPKDFDGKTFATFGSNESDAVIRRMIQTDVGQRAGRHHRDVTTVEANRVDEESNAVRQSDRGVGTVLTIVVAAGIADGKRK